VGEGEPVEGILDVGADVLDPEQGKEEGEQSKREIEEEDPVPAGEAPFLFPCETEVSRPVPKVNNAHDRAVKDSKVRKFRLYDLRHTWATRVAESGIDLVTLASLLGHSKIQMVLRYAHPTQEHQARSVERLEQFNAVRQMEALLPEQGTATSV
jgi:integrase